MDSPNINFFADPQVRFAWDNLRDGVLDKSLLLWEAYDTVTESPAQLVGRKVGDKVLPLALLLPDSTRTVQRYAPALANGSWDFAQIKKD